VVGGKDPATPPVGCTVVIIVSVARDVTVGIENCAHGGFLRKGSVTYGRP